MGITSHAVVSKASKIVYNVIFRFHEIFHQNTIMSASPMARQAATLHAGIPTRRVVINNENEMPTEYGTTPGGTIFGTTPGGTRIIYERAFLMKMRHSPLAKTPPANLPVIPGVTVPKDSSANDSNDKQENGHDHHKLQTVTESAKEEEEAQFDMDI